MADRSLEGMALPLEVRARLAELELELSEGNRPPPRSSCPVQTPVPCAPAAGPGRAVTPGEGSGRRGERVDARGDTRGRGVRGTAVARPGRGVVPGAGAGECVPGPRPGACAPPAAPALPAVLLWWCHDPPARCGGAWGAALGRKMEQPLGPARNGLPGDVRSALMESRCVLDAAARCAATDHVRLLGAA
jgi:hypothetical protein